MGTIKIRFEGTGELQPDGSMRVIGTLAPLSLPSEPQNLRALEVTDASSSIAWDAGEDAASWVVFRDDGAGGALAEYATAASPTYEDTSVSPSTTYRYNVKAVNAAGLSGFAEDDLVIETPAAPPATPDAPENLQVEELTAARVSFSWSGAPGVLEWDVLREAVVIATVTELLYTDDTVEPGTEYDYTVIARNANGDSDPSDPLTVNVPANTAPEWLTGIATQNGSVGDSFTLQLDENCSDADGHAVTFALAPGSPALPDGIAFSANAKQLVGTFAADGTFSPVIRASDGHDTSDLEIVFTIAAVADTTGPTAPVIGPATANGSTVTIPLVTPATDPSGIKNYQIWRSNDGGANFVFRQAIEETGFPWSETDVPNGTYQYRARANDLSPNENRGDYSEVTEVTVGVPVPNPDVPTNFSGVRLEATNVSLSWSPGSSGPAPTDYDLRFSKTSSTGPWTDLPFSGAGTSTTHSTSNADTWYAVKALTATGESAWSSAILVPEVSTAPRNVYYTADWEEGQAASAGDLENGGRFACKFQPEGGVNTWTGQNNGGGQTASNLDARVLASENFQGEAITPRRGSYFYRQALYYNKEYECMNNSSSGANDQLDKPRTFFSLNATPYRHDFDRETWLGFSIFVRENHVHDIGTRAHQGGCNLLNITAGGEESPQFTLKSFARFNSDPGNYIGGLGGNTEHYMLWYGIRANSPAEPNKTAGSNFTYYADLGDVEDDRGLWTDWVFRYRLNPFTSSTNASSVGGKNHVYEGNKGILQIWKSTGPYLNANKDRAMTRVFNIFNAPIGLVPHATGRLNLRFDLYKYGWKKNTTTNTGIVYYGIDEIRFGFRKAPQAGEVFSQSGTKDIDVNPSGLALPNWVEQS